jgi:2-methylisocitrate lyase-like PEP mutase family enzyme
VEPFALAEELVGVGPAPTAHERRTALRAAIAAGTVVLPGATDAMGVRLVERAGFLAAYATGAGLANAQYGLPDLGLVSLGEVAEHVGRLAAATRLPLVVDADTGFGGPVMAMRAARLLERAGAAALQLEDQEMPKRCGHFDSHALIPAEHMQAKLVAVRQALEDDATVVIARTDARSVHDIDEAIRRARLYVEAGADVIFVEAPRTVDELRRVGEELAGTPLVVNVVEGGKTPELALETYRELGFGIVLFANFLMRCMMRAGQEGLAHLHEHGETSSWAGRMAGWQERQALFNLPAFQAAESHYDAAVQA